MVIRPRMSMRLIRRSGVLALSALVLSLAPPFAGVGSATEPTASVAPGTPRSSAQLDQLQPWLGLRFKPDGASGQCGNAGEQWVPLSVWTNPIRFDTDNRTGGCQLTLDIYDPVSIIPSALAYDWLVSLGGDGRQCGNQGHFVVPVFGQPGFFGSGIRVDTDDKAGWCNLTFTIDETGPNLALDIQFWSDGDPGQCINRLAKGEYHTVTLGTPVTIGINTDNRPGGCSFSIQLRLI